jgi:hypothetical protein
MAAAEWSKYGNAGGWQLPPKKQANQQRGMMPDYYNNQNSAVPYDQAGADWESFSARNKQRANLMINAQKQGMPMDQIKAMIDRDVGQRGWGGSSSIGAGMGLKSPSPLSGYGSPSFREKYNAGAALKANKDNSLADNMRDENAGITVGQFGDYFDAVRETQGGGGGGAWYDDLWKEAKGLGIKGWGEIGIGAMNAYTGWQETEMAKKQHGLAQETFDFQKAAYNKDREGRVLAYNTNAQNVNAWKEAQGRTDLNKLMV